MALSLTKRSTKGSRLTHAEVDANWDAIKTDVDLNTLKTTNATHTGEVTGATVLTIASDVVDHDNLTDELKKRTTNATVTTTYAIDWSVGNVFELTMTGNTTFSDSNLPTGTDTKDIIIIMDGNFTPTFDSNWEVTPNSDSYSGTVRNLIIASCVNGTGGSIDVIYHIQNLTT